MKKIGQSVLLGLVVAGVGLYVSAFAGSFFSGMDFGSASVLGICLYLCVVVVTCTGVIVAKLDEKSPSGEKDEK